MEEDRKKYDGKVVPLEFESSEGPPYKLTEKCKKRLVDESVIEKVEEVEEGEPK